jgi:hypothetical protein
MMRNWRLGRGELPGLLSKELKERLPLTPCGPQAYRSKTIEALLARSRYQAIPNHQPRASGPKEEKRPPHKKQYSTLPVAELGGEPRHYRKSGVFTRSDLFDPWRWLVCLYRRAHNPLHTNGVPCRPRLVVG